MNSLKIFSYLDSTSNNKFSSLSDNSKLELVNYINQYYLELRNSIDISDDDTFGFEFEAENFRYEKIYSLMTKYGFNLSDWIIKCETSLYKGYEVVTPILNKDNIDWQQIELICEIIKHNSVTGIHAASHIHVGAQILKNSKECIIRLILLWCAYENVLYRFSYGEFINERPYISKYAKPNAGYWYKMLKVFKRYENIDSFDMIKWLSCNDKNMAINLTNVKSLDELELKNTIEFRLFNSTLNPIIWQNNYNLINHLLKYCNNDMFDYDLITNRLNKNIKNFENFSYYKQIDIASSFELADLIFNTNLDKIYFLKQYLKDGRETDKKLLVKSKQLTTI